MLTSSPATDARPVPRRTALVVVLLATLLAVQGGVGPARADAGAASQLVGWIDQERAAAGVHALRVADDLVAVATRHAQRMAAEGRLYHNPRRAEEVSGWQRLTENVGYGSGARPVHDTLMASASHRANIVDAGVSQVGVGTAWDEDGTLWVAQVFRQPTATAEAAPPPHPPAPATTAPRPATASGPRPTTTRVPSPPRVLTFALPDVDVAPEPASMVGSAARGRVPPPHPALAAQVRGAARWVLVVLALLGA